MSEAINPRIAAPGLLSGVIFFAVVLLGCGYIVFSKIHGFAPVFVTLAPVAIMIAYALLLGFARFFRLRDDQSGDNLYYMGFLFTLTSLGVSLYQYSSHGSAEEIVQNFGVAIASTIAGVALRIFFNQMRRDPVEVEHFARLELAEASRKVKRELESTVLEFAYFRRATQQSISESLEEVKEILSEAKASFTGQLKEFAETSSEPLERASQKSGETIESVSSRIAGALDQIAGRLTEQTRLIAESSASTVQALDGVAAKLKSMQTPEQTIEIKLDPAIQSLSHAVTAFAQSAQAHAQTISENIAETQRLNNAAADLLRQAREHALAPKGFASSSYGSRSGEATALPAPPKVGAPPFRSFFSRRLMEAKGGVDKDRPENDKNPS